MGAVELSAELVDEVAELVVELEPGVLLETTLLLELDTVKDVSEPAILEEVEEEDKEEEEPDDGPSAATLLKLV